MITTALCKQTPFMPTLSQELTGSPKTKPTAFFAFNTLIAFSNQIAPGSDLPGKTRQKVGMTTDLVDWFVSLFAQQLERETGDLTVDPDQGWSVPALRRSLRPPEAGSSGFYFPTAPVQGTYWSHIIYDAPKSNLALHGRAEYADRFIFRLHHVDFSSPATANPRVHTFKKAATALLSRAAGSGLPAEAHKCLDQLYRRLPDGSGLNKWSRRVDGIAQKGHKIRVLISSGDLYWTEPHIGTILLTVSAPDVPLD